MSIQKIVVLWGLVLSCLCLTAKDSKSNSRVLKVLPHYLDSKGLHTVSPSLFERDAYQAHLKDHPELVSTMRFDVHCRMDLPDLSDMKVRVEARFGKGNSIDTMETSAPIKRPRWGKRSWTRVTLDQEAFDAQARLIAWRVTLWQGDTLLASQTSFLW